MRIRRLLVDTKVALAGVVGCATILASVPAAAGTAQRYLDRPAEWFRGEEALKIAESILSYQSELGGWPKNVDTTAAPFRGDRKSLDPTFDNGATMDELRFLARIYGARQDARYREAFERGLAYILKAQYPTGGWPQFYPPGRDYHRHITLNDNSMVRILRFLREVGTSATYEFVGKDRRAASLRAFERGIECILRCQIEIDGVLTAWCAQHDEKDLSPRKGRSYELATLSGSESVEIVRLLLSVDGPSPEVVRAVDAAVRWFEAAKLQGIRQDRVQDAKSPKGWNKVVVEDPSAPPLWARFYEIGTNRPIYCDRDGVAKYRLDQIGYERRNGYSWLGDWPRSLVEKEYPEWKSRITPKSEETRESTVGG